MSHKENLTRYHAAAALAGLSHDDAETLRRAAQTLHRWAEHKCNGVIQRAEAGQTDHKGRPMPEGACYSVGNINGPGPLTYWRTADRETPALARARAIAASVGATLEHQGDPRGWPLTLKLPDGREVCPPVRS